MHVCIHPCTCEYTHREYMMLIDQVKKDKVSNAMFDLWLES